ncbi:MAG: FAD-binding protein [Elusimicrobia bacterium]|nr:FAD-binding protein [Elusimicrobiota bacterium]
MSAPRPSAALAELSAQLPPGALLSSEAELAAYAYDAAHDRARPDGIVLARSALDVQRCVAFCAARRLPFVARGAGTNLSGGCVASRGGLVICLARLDRIERVDADAMVAVAQPGVVNLDLQRAAEPLGLFYAPDPASFRVSTIGGNIAENAGGPRCLKYGTTTNHVLALEAVMPDGRLSRFSLEDEGPELLSLLVGSEGTLGIVTRAWLRLLKRPPAVETLLAGFDSIDACVACVSAVIAAGLVPRALEAMDKTTVEAVEAYASAGYPRSEAVLLVEFDGESAEVERSTAEAERLCRAHGAVELRAARDPARRERLWEGRRGAYAAMARLAPNVRVEDGVVPRDKLPEIVRRIREVMERRGVKGGLLFHAGDGNIHPNMVYDERDPAQAANVREAGHEILRACVELGGSLSGEHGIGLDKREAMAWLFSERTLELFSRVKAAMDPHGLANPDKIIPLPGGERAYLPPPARELSAAARRLAAQAAGCAAAGRAMRARGAGTRLSRPLEPGAALLELSELSELRELDRGNLTATVEAGILVRELRERLGRQGVFTRLPDVEGTLGGLLAARPCAWLRDEVLGLRLLLADGGVCELGGKVVKNVAGYDLTRLLLGSWGGLAVILEATLRLYALPQRPPPIIAGGSRQPRPYGPWARQLKAAFDPGNLLNPWLAD